MCVFVCVCGGGGGLRIRRGGQTVTTATDEVTDIFLATISEPFCLVFPNPHHSIQMNHFLQHP